MPRKQDDPAPERAQTDESLRAERERTDLALSLKKAAAEREAGKVLQRARVTADAVLATARDEADLRLDATAPPSAALASIATERQKEDTALRVERAAADESVRREREENARALAMLLPLERNQTDQHLLTERARSDDSVANRDDFLGLVSHDLRNLLGAIVVGAAVMAKAATDNEDGKKIVAGTDRIQRYAAQMNRLISDLVDIAAIEAGKLSVVPAPGDVRTPIRAAIEMFEQSAQAKRIALTTDVGDDPLPAHFDHDRLLQVLGNVLANALKFTAEGGAVSIRAEECGGELRVSIADTGCGIPPEMLDLVFERFWQVGENDRRGSGLGLYISRSILEAHGGRMWAESAPGTGSTLFMALPLAAA